MEKEIYIKLLNEGTLVYRPVVANEKGKEIYEVKGFDIYNPEDEEWEFTPGSLVKVEERILEGSLVLIAIEELK